MGHRGRTQKLGADFRPEVGGDADAFGVADRDTVDVRVDSDGRSLVFGDVLVRVSPDFVLEMHVDTDEGNAAGLERRSEGVLAGTGGEAAVLRRSPGLAR